MNQGKGICTAEWTMHPQGSVHVNVLCRKGMAKGMTSHQLSSTSGTVCCISFGKEMPSLPYSKNLQPAQRQCSLSLTCKC